MTSDVIDLKMTFDNLVRCLTIKFVDKRKPCRDYFHVTDVVEWKS